MSIKFKGNDLHYWLHLTSTLPVYKAKIPFSIGVYGFQIEQHIPISDVVCLWGEVIKWIEDAQKFGASMHPNFHSSSDSSASTITRTLGSWTVKGAHPTRLKPVNECIRMNEWNWWMNERMERASEQMNENSQLRIAMGIAYNYNSSVYIICTKSPNGSRNAHLPRKSQIANIISDGFLHCTTVRGALICIWFLTGSVVCYMLAHKLSACYQLSLLDFPVCLRASALTESNLLLYISPCMKSHNIPFDDATHLWLQFTNIQTELGLKLSLCQCSSSVWWTRQDKIEKWRNQERRSLMN